MSVAIRALPGPGQVGPEPPIAATQAIIGDGARERWERGAAERRRRHLVGLIDQVIGRCEERNLGGEAAGPPPLIAVTLIDWLQREAGESARRPATSVEALDELFRHQARYLRGRPAPLVARRSTEAAPGPGERAESAPRPAGEELNARVREWGPGSSTRLLDRRVHGEGAGDRPGQSSGHPFAVRQLEAAARPAELDGETKGAVATRPPDSDRPVPSRSRSKAWPPYGSPGIYATPGPEIPSVASRALADLTTRLREVLDQVVVLARYASDLEDELDCYRAAMLQLQHRLDAALAEPS
jgi:hypothetical protein